MSEIRIQKIDGVEFVTYKDYLRLKEEKQELEYLGDINEGLKEENKKLNKQIEQFKKGVKAGTNIIEKLEGENKMLKGELERIKKELEGANNSGEEFAHKRADAKAENKKLKYVIDSVMEKADIEYVRLADGDVFTNPKNKLHISDTIQIDILNGKQ